ncbi:AlwI family type II restriction endonuclease [Chitinophaga sp.]|uniref:AlwI family type II restriction endonuclease n=1 Tax=Chitinophaga sp. TaxID=1869181 RepID=UPI0031DF5369
MPNVWNIGNTTVRNPKRIETALKIFVEEGFSGNAKGSEAEARLHAKLKEKGVLEFEGNPSDWNGRKWRAAFYQLGFISYERYNIGGTRFSVEGFFTTIGVPDIHSSYQLTPAGTKLINARLVPEMEEIYTRQFACYELPNALESNFARASMKPFILFLQVLKLLQNEGHEGLNKFETGLFLQRFRNHTPQLPQQIAHEVLDFRRQLAECTSSAEARELRNRHKEALGREVGINPNSVVGDYADTTFRYFSLSGLFTLIGQRITIRHNKMAFVNSLLESQPAFLYSTNPTRYLEYFYKGTFPLPTDNTIFALEEINILKNEIRDRSSPLWAEANVLNEDTDIQEVQTVRFLLTEYNNRERETDFAAEQQSPGAIADILRYLKVLNGEAVPDGPEIDDRPAYLEWAVWRSFLAINEIVSPVYKTRRFLVDQDFQPRSTAPGGGADLLFEFETYVLVVEVTLTNSNRQMAVESEPVRRHTVQYKEQFPDKDVYCLFIAPNVDNNVAETFRIGVWYKQDREEFVNIVPMNLSDFIKVVESLTIRRYTNVDFRNLIEKCLVLRNVRAPQWKSSISNEVNAWQRRIAQA